MYIKFIKDYKNSLKGEIKKVQKSAGSYLIERDIGRKYIESNARELHGIRNNRVQINNDYKLLATFCNKKVANKRTNYGIYRS